MKKYKKCISIACGMMILASSLMMAGCSSGHTAGGEILPQSVSLVLGVHEFFPMIPTNAESLYGKVYEACLSYGKCSATIIDGSPYLAFDYNIKEPDKHLDEAKKKQIAKDCTEQILSEVSKAKAKTGEIDVLSALTLSAQSLKSSSGDKTMLIFDSGLSTLQPLNFSQENLIEAPPDAVVEQLEAIHAIPDFSGIGNITWVGLGTTCGEQEKLTSDYKHKLKELWQAILTAGGASSITFDPSPLPDAEYDGDLPACMSVPVITKSLDLPEASMEEDIPEVVKFDEGTSVKFKGDMSEFVDDQAASEALAPIAEYLKNSGSKILIVGTTATVPSYPDEGKRLSLQRARACEAVLLANGVDARQLHCVGLGHTPNPLRAKDLDEQGNLIEEMARLNRAVFFIREDSALADTIS